MRFDLTTILAIWGVVLSTVLAGIRVHEYIRDRRPHVQVSFEPKVLVPLFGATNLTECCEIRAVNTGRVPATIAALVLQLCDGTTFNPLRLESYSRLDMPATLTQSQGLSAFLRRAEVPLEKVTWAFARATDGTIYKSKPFKIL
jgi:hypothetical protein